MLAMLPHKKFKIFISFQLFGKAYLRWLVFSGFDVNWWKESKNEFLVCWNWDGFFSSVGFPSVGKSTLLTTLAGVYSEVAAYEFTTLTTVPGVIRYKGAKIQLLDLPGIIEGAKDGKGRGRQVIAGVVMCSALINFISIDMRVLDRMWSRFK